MDTHKLLSGEDRALGAPLLRALLTPLAGLHWLGLKLYLLPYRLGLRKRYCLPVPVISIGNLTSGGTGKTPMAALVGQLLREQGLRVVLLSRGHGGSHEKGKGAQIVSRGEGQVLLSAEIAGDEPTLLARLLPDIPVIVGRDRRVSGKLACETFAPDVVLLDDALQFWQLHRDLDIVLLDTRRPFDTGWLLPRGLLREPPSHLSRAGIIVLTRADRVSEAQREQQRQHLQRLAPQAAVFTAIHAPLGWIAPEQEALLPLDSLAGQSVVAFSGIADGAAFVYTLKQLGLTLKFSREFSDHHTYNKKETFSLIEQAPDALFVTTEKDLTKLATLWPSSGPALRALRIGMILDNQEAFEQSLKNLHGRTRNPNQTISSTSDNQRPSPPLFPGGGTR